MIVDHKVFQNCLRGVPKGMPKGVPGNTALRWPKLDRWYCATTSLGTKTHIRVHTFYNWLNIKIFCHIYKTLINISKDYSKRDQISLIILLPRVNPPWTIRRESKHHKSRNSSFNTIQTWRISVFWSQEWVHWLVGSKYSCGLCSIEISLFLYPPFSHELPTIPQFYFRRTIRAGRAPVYQSF